MGLHAKYLETSRASKANWAARNRERINAKRRERRLKKRIKTLAGKRCLNCEVFIVERLDWSPGRSYLYCRKCLSEYREETRRHKWRRYYNRKNGIKSTVIKQKRQQMTFIDRLKQSTFTEPMKEPEPPKEFMGFDKIRVAKKTLTPISTCPCGNNYLKTRPGQTVCLPCIAYGHKARSEAVV